MPRPPAKPFEQFLKDKAKSYLKISRRGDMARAMSTVTLVRRLRAQSLSDQFGQFSPNGSNAWLGDAQGAMAFSNMKSLNVVKPMVQLVSTALVSAQVKLEIAAANKDPELGGAANVARGLFEYWNGRQGYWDSNLKNRLAGMICVAYGCFFRTHESEMKKQGLMTPEFGQENLPVPGKYACKHCRTEGPFVGDVQEGNFPTTQCPSCGQEAEVIEEPSESPMEVPTGEKELECSDNQTTVVSPLEIRLDERYSQNAGIDKVQWLDYHPLRTEEEMYSEFGDFDFGSPLEWSFSQRWKHALETGTIVYEKSASSSDDNETDFKAWEVRNIWMRPEQYLTYKSLSAYQIKDAKGEVVDELEPDQKIIEKFPDGFRFNMTGDKILPGIKPSDLTQEWDYCGLSPDPFSFWYRPLVEWIQLQDDVNTMYTIDMQHRERNSQVGIIYKDEAFDAESFENDLIPTKAGYSMEEPIRDYVQTFQTPPMNEAKTGLGMLLTEIIPSFGGYQPAAVGAPSPNEPYAAQLLQKQQAMGQLAQAQQSQANAEVGWFKKNARLAQKWPPAKLEYIRTRLGEEWKEADIEAFIKCDIERDLDIDVLEGSEIPTSLIEREVKLNNFVTQLAGLPPEFAQAMPPEFVKSVVSQWVASVGIDADFDNVEGQNRLDTARYEVIKQEAQKKQGVPPQEAVQQIEALPILTILPREEHDTSIEFWGDHQMAAMAEQSPESTLLVLMFGIMIAKHEAAKTEQGKKQTADELEVQQPAIEAQSATENSGAGAAKEAQDQEAQLKAAQLEADQENEQARIDAENQRTQVDAQNAEADRSHELTTMAMQHAHEKETLAKEHELKERLEAKKIEAQKQAAQESEKVKPKVTAK